MAGAPHQRFSMRLGHSPATGVVRNATLGSEPIGGPQADCCSAPEWDSCGVGVPALDSLLGSLRGIAWTGSRTSAQHERDLRHRRHRHGGLLGVLHAKPVVPGASAPARRRPRPLQLRQSFRYRQNPLRQPHPRRRSVPAALSVSRNPVFAETIEQLRQIDGGLDMFRRLDGQVLIALDGSEYHCSRRESLPALLDAARAMAGRSISTACWRPLVAPGHDKVIPLEPEFIVPQDGAEKQDCENMAARKRWLAAHANATRACPGLSR